MKTWLIRVGSVTYAMKTKQLLLSYGLHPQIVKNPHPKAKEGCGYAVAVEDSILNLDLLLQRAHIPYSEMKGMP